MFDLRLLITTRVNYHLAGQFNNERAVGEGILLASSNIEWLVDLCRRCSYDRLCIFVVPLSVFWQIWPVQRDKGNVRPLLTRPEPYGSTVWTGTGLGDILGHFENNA